MDKPQSRRSFVVAAGGSMAGFALPTDLFRHPMRRHEATSFPHQEPELVRRAVQYSHFDLDAVRELVTDRPALAVASWDWGFGDWETPLGAASHVGRRDVAEYLLEEGARPDIFTFAMLGNVDAVRAMIEGHPGVQRLAGPHGLSLLHHARSGGEEAADMLAYLQEVGDADPQPADLPLTGGERAEYLGRYELIDSEGIVFEIIEQRQRIAFRYAQEAPRNLLNQGGQVFHPVGAPAVRFRFSVRGGSVNGLSIRDGDAEISAERIAVRGEP